MYSNAAQSAEYISKKIGSVPDAAIVLGSGLGGFADELENPIIIPYGDIPHFPVSTAPDHKGQMVVGFMGGRKLLCMQGRFHFYEGYTMREVSYYVRVLKLLGIRALIITNAAGSLDEAIRPGDFMLITDHINFMGANPLSGPNDGRYGERFVDMSYAYDPALRALISRAAYKLGIALKEGVYVGYMGPSYETPAEIRMFRMLGGSAVGMSTVPEVIEANHCGIPVAGITCVTNMAAGISDKRLSSEEVISVGNQVSSEMLCLLRETVSLI